ncbi:MAG: phosphodiester glycosidase family protein [bacterium]
MKVTSLFCNGFWRLVCFIILTFSLFSLNGDRSSEWETLSEGLEFAEITLDNKAVLQVLRADLSNYELTLHGANFSDGKKRTASEWGEKYGLSAAINAGMYHPDNSGVGYMSRKGKTNGTRMPSDYKAVLAFDRKDSSVPEAKIIDFGCDKWHTIKKKYGSLVQSIRMYSCKGRNVWATQPEKWSTAALATDKKGKVLFIHCRQPMRVHDFINSTVKAIPSISRMMYLEGGAEASLYISSGDRSFSFSGAYFKKNSGKNRQNRQWHIPNVIGLKKKKK